MHPEVLPLSYMLLRLSTGHTNTHWLACRYSDRVSIWLGSSPTLPHLRVDVPPAPDRIQNR